MSIKHYDIAIIGGSLSARIAAALLAKRGSKVLFLRYREATATAWFPSSLFLEKLLGTLGGRSCFVAQKPIQVFSRKARVTLNNDVPLADELDREFGRDGAAVTLWLEQLRLQGEQLEKLLWENGGLSWPTLQASARFKLLSLRRKVNWRELDAPISQSLERLAESARELMTDLLQGLALQGIEHLSRAHAALLWAQVTRPENLKEPDFSELLSKRFDQFHGLKGELEELTSLDCSGSRWTGGHLRGGGHFTADTFLLGDARWIDHFKQVKTAELPAALQLTRYNTTPLTGQLSSLLATRVICGGAIPLRLAIEERDAQLYGQLRNAYGATEQQLREQLAPVLPFADYTLTREVDALTPRVESGREAPQQLSLASLPLRLGSNLFCVDSGLLLPEMGAAGAALLGWTVAERLVGQHKGEKE